jgi:hypothetical protein
VILVDPDGRDWYESEDKKTIEYLHGVTGQREGYTHLGATFGEEYEKNIRNGDYSTVFITANFTEKEFVTQKPNQCCAAAREMCMNRGGEWSTHKNELLVVTKDEKNGRAGDGIKNTLFDALERVGMSLAKGIPVVAGMDHKDGSTNLIKKGGDGMTDHYVAIIGITLNFTKGDNGASISNGTIRYANPGNSTSKRGLSPHNIFTFSAITKWRVERKYNQTMTNIRVR